MIKINDFDFILDREKSEKIIADDTLVLFLFMFHPRMPGTYLFTTRLQYLHFPPDTDKNEEFIFGTSSLGGTLWAMIGIPKYYLGLAKKIADECGLNIVDGMPHLFSGKEATSFLSDGKNMFSLENAEDSEAYRSNPQEIEDIIKKENEEISEIMKDPEGYKEKKSKEPKKLKVQWD